MKHFARSIFFAAAVLAVAGAQAATVKGSANGLTWEARNTIVGQTSTATVAGGGNPTYQAPMPLYSGVTYLLMEYEKGGFVCTGSLLSDRASVLTAAHCLKTSADTGALLKTTAFFYNGTNRDANLFQTGIGVMSYVASGTTIHPLYSGEVIDQNDIAVVTLNGYVDRKYSTYDLYTGGSLTGVDFNVAGYGGRSDAGGSIGANLGTGRLRQGNNRYDFAMGDADFGGFFTQPSWYGAMAQNVLLSDFDNGTSGNDTSCQLAGAFGLGGTKYCNTGRGAREVGVAGGDSGGPQFVNGQIASVTSFGLSFGSDFGDVDDALNSSFGEFSGFVPVSIHRNFIESLRVPEPGSLALVGLAGFMMLAARRRKTQA